MNTHEAFAALQHVTYKPRFELDLTDFGDGIGSLQMMTDVLNADNPTQQIPIYRVATFPFGHLRSVTDLYGLVGARLREFENHEVDEWFRIDGRPFVEPHPERLLK